MYMFNVYIPVILYNLSMVFIYDKYLYISVHYSKILVMTRKLHKYINMKLINYCNNTVIIISYNIVRIIMSRDLKI